MKATFVQRLAVLVAILAVAGSAAFAGQKNEGASQRRKLPIVADATIDGQRIARGEYNIEITGGDEALLIVWRGKEEIARVPVERTERAKAAPYDQIESRKTDEGGVEITAVTFKGGTQTYLVKGVQRVAKSVNP